MHTAWHELLANLAVVALFVSAWTNLGDWTAAWSRNRRSLAFGVLMGLGAVAVMLIPVQLSPGRFTDLRFTMISLAGFFGGPLAGLAGGAIAAAYRVGVGGGGAWGGVVSITASMLVGIGGCHLLRGGMPTRMHIAMLGVATGAASLAGFFVSDMWVTNLPLLGPPLSTRVFASTLVAGLVIYQDDRRRQITRENFTYRAIIESLPDCLNAKDLDGRFIAANPATAELMHAGSAAALIGRSDFDFYAPETAGKFKADEAGVIAAGRSATLEQEIVRSDGSTVWLSTMKTPLRDQAGTIVGLITHNRDVTERKQLALKLLETQSRLSIALTNMADALVIFDRNGRLVFCNPQYQALFPKTADVRVAGAYLADILRIAEERGEERGAAIEKVEAWAAGRHSGEPVDLDREFRLADGRWLFARTRSTSDGGVLTVLSDITARKQADAALSALNDRLEVLAMTDGLTNLMNRRGFDHALQDEFARSRRSGRPVSLLMIDVDRFKLFNDTYGHPAGDACLRTISECLTQTLKREIDKPARYGGEELSVILPDTDGEGALHVAEAFRRALRELKIPHGKSPGGIVTVSIGVSTYARGVGLSRARDLVTRADQALYAAKDAGRDCVQEWLPERSMKNAV